MAGVQPEQIERLASKMGFEGKSAQQAADIMTKLYNLFIQTDATLVEINPLAETPDGDVFACDSKLNFDDNAEFRQPAIFAYRDRAQEDPREVEASQYGLNYISLDGKAYVVW
jgi:succinyl-CoA synthetase beta subunit